MTPFKGADAIGVVERNCQRYGVMMSYKQKEEIINQTGGHAGMIKFMIQNLTDGKAVDVDMKLTKIDKVGDICLQNERILAPLTDLEKSKLKNKERDELLVNLGFQIKIKENIKIFSPILEKYVSNNSRCTPLFCIDLENGEIYFKGKPLRKELTVKEWKLLELLIGKRNNVVKREVIINRVWDDENVSDWTIDKLLSRLRKKLNDKKQNYVKTIKGVGVMMDNFEQ